MKTAFPFSRSGSPVSAAARLRVISAFTSPPVSFHVPSRDWALALISSGAAVAKYRRTVTGRVAGSNPPKVTPLPSTASNRRLAHSGREVNTSAAVARRAGGYNRHALNIKVGKWRPPSSAAARRTSMVKASGVLISSNAAIPARARSSRNFRTV